MIRPALVFCLVGLLFAVQGGCKRSDSHFGRVSELRLALGELPDWAQLETHEVVERVSASLRRSGRLDVNLQSSKRQVPEDWSSRIEIMGLRELPDPEGDARVEIAIRLSLERPDLRVQTEGSGRAAFAGFDAKAAPRAAREAVLGALEEALHGATAQLARQLAALEKSEAELIADLTSDDPEIRDVAVRMLSDRRSVAAVPALIERLKDSERDIQLRTVGALVEIGDPRAAPALVDATAQRDPGFVAQVSYALAQIGGPDAEAFLFTASTGHPDATVRRAASEALESLHANRKAAAARQPQRLAK